MEKFPEGGGFRGRILFHEGTFAEIISLDNLFSAWRNYCRGKRSKNEVHEFEFRLEDNIFQLHRDLRAGRYRPGKYQNFLITDPKLRIISKSSVRDRLFHQAIYQVLYPAFDDTFIFDSYSCRVGKGTHRAFKRLVYFARKVSQNYTEPCWGLKMDIKKFFDSIDHEMLFDLLTQRIDDPKLLHVLYDIIQSFELSSGKGVPLGNLTSQLFANIYMDPLDKFVKHKLKAKYYLRYADDFLIVSNSPGELMGYFVEMSKFVREQLKLQVHPGKTSLRKLCQGIDFVGYVALSHYQLPRHRTVERIFRKTANMSEERLEEVLPSYLGYLQHVSSHDLSKGLIGESKL